MDPLSAVASAASLAFACVNAARALHSLRRRYKIADTMITSITSECTAIHAALTQLQRLALSDSFFQQLESQPELGDSLDLSLLSCMQTFSALDAEIQEITQGSDETSDRFFRLKYLWNEDTMKEILQQLRCQQNTINLLLTAFQVASISEIHQLLLRGNPVLERFAARSDELWAFHRKSSHSNSSILNFHMSLHSDTDSTFEGQLRSSGVYRRVSMANRRARESEPDTFANGDLIDLSIDETADIPTSQPYLDELKRAMASLELLPVSAVNCQHSQSLPSNSDAPVVPDSHTDEEKKTENEQPTSEDNENDILLEKVNGLLLIEYRKTMVKERIPTIQYSLSKKLPDGWFLRTSPTGKAYYIDHFERYLFSVPPVIVNTDDISRALPPGWKRVETETGRVRWVHLATGFVSHKHPYDNSRLFAYDFLSDWPFGKHGERKGMLNVYPRAFDYVGDDDGACQMTAEAFKLSIAQMEAEALKSALLDSEHTRTAKQIACRVKEIIMEIHDSNIHNIT